MKKILNTLLIAVLILNFACCLRLHNHRPSHTYAESPEQLANLTEAENIVKSKLSIVSMQIAATNGTISKNVYIGTFENGTVKLTSAANLTAKDLQSQA